VKGMPRNGVAARAAMTVLVVIAREWPEGGGCARCGGIGLEFHQLGLWPGCVG